MKLDREQWRQLSALLDTALETAADERETWLQNLGGDASALKEPLRILLAQRARIETGEFARQPNFAAALRVENARSHAQPAELQQGAEAGAYRLLRELGRGGMGSVWLAERIDGKLKRQVALKFPYAGPNQRQLAERLTRERDILASLEHPNIARLYDADLTKLGQPFLVLEYVDGIAINDYCDQHHLTIRERLVLFLQVLSAVQYAHMHLVIHRDLKPSNILITQDRIVHLLDFGIAKLISDGETQDSALTQFGGRALTPDYASPEQINGESITTACDVYSLGVVLYELLTGSRPYRLKRDSQASLEEAIAEANVVAPSRAILSAEMATLRSVSMRKFIGELRGDIDTILGKALQKNPIERYASVDALLKDIERALDGEVIAAQQPSTAYRLRKFITRNKIAVASATAVTMALLIGITVALWQLRVARAEQRRAEDVKEFVSSIFKSADPFFTGKQSMSAAELLAIARTRIDKELTTQPKNAVELLTIVGESQLNLEQRDAARSTLEKAIERGTKSLDAGNVYVAEARAILAAIYVGERNDATAKQLLAQALPVLRKNGAMGARALSEALHNQAEIDFDEGNHDLAIAAGREAVEVDKAALGDLNSETLMSKHHLALELLMVGRAAEALPIAEGAYRDARAEFTSGEHNGVLVETEDLYGRVLAEMGQLDSGMEHLHHSIQDSVALFGPTNNDVAARWGFLARAQLRLGDLQGMLDSTQHELAASSNPLDHSRAKAKLGNVFLLMREIPKAIEELQTAVNESRQSDLGKQSWLAFVSADYGISLLLSDQLAEGEKVLRENLRILGDSTGPFKVLTLNGLGMASAMSNNNQQSLQRYREAFALSSDGVGMTSVLRIEALKGIGLALLDTGQTKEAEATLREADATAAHAFQRIIPLRVDVMVGLGRAALDQGHMADALPLLMQANSFWVGYSADSRWAGESAYWYGRTLLAGGQTIEAKNHLQRAVKILKTSKLTVDALLVADARTRLAHLQN